MRLFRLSCVEPAIVTASVELAGGNVQKDSFTVVDANGNLLANPDPDVFTAGMVAASRVRDIIAAVIAFERVSASGSAES